MIRVFFGIFTILATACAITTAQAQTIESDTLMAVFNDSKISVSDKSGKTLFVIKNIYPYFTGLIGKPVSAEKISPASLRVNYDFGKKTDAKAVGTIVLNGDSIDIEYNIDDSKSFDGKMHGLLQDFAPADKSVKLKPVFKSGIWTRAPFGGTPFEKRGAYLKIIEAPDAVFASAISGNHFYCGGSRTATELKKDGNIYKGSVRIEMFKGKKDFEAAAAIDKQAYAVRLSTDKNFNLFEDSNPQFTVELSPTSADSKSANYKLKVFDYDGKLVVSDEKKIDFGDGTRKTFKYTIDSKDRNIFFADASLVDDNTSKEVFSRINMAILPPHKYHHCESSRMGLSGNFKLQENPNIAKLWNRIGVKYSRNGDNSKTQPLGITSFATSNPKPLAYNPKKDYKVVKALVDRVEATKAPWLEFGNEWSTSGPARRNMDIKSARAGYYVQWLKAIREELSKRKIDVKIMSVSTGGSGGDTAFYQMLYELGAWDMLDAMTFHPGRGNCTPDNIKGGWTYLGSIKNMKKKIRELGDKPMFITEAYAATQPNNAWCDSYRHAGENVLLTMSIGYAENIPVVFMFKFNDGVSFDINGVNEKNREWNYGIMMRDFSPKPSMMAYATAAEHLDGAKFVRWISIDDTKLSGMEFDSPRGKFHILYDRTDGFWYPKKNDTFAHKDAWIDTWKSKIPYKFDTTADEIFVYDAIGRKTAIPSKDKKANLTLSGAPIIVYGLKL